MDNSIDKLRQKIQELEGQLRDYVIALRVLESLEEVDISSPAIRRTVITAEPKMTLKDLVISIIRASVANVTTDYIIRKYMEIRNLDSRKIASNSIYPTLSNLAKEGFINKTSIPNDSASYWKLNEQK